MSLDRENGRDYEAEETPYEQAGRIAQCRDWNTASKREILTNKDKAYYDRLRECEDA